ncbi:MAG TPA: acylphosphatase [Rariglobus sp.]|jgi:acylphosphatase|nr:acylphosphatase [Rariglobus sp.]
MAEAHYEIVYFTGMVQGVGFRYTVLQVAKEFEVAGCVKNLADGRVQVEAEGDSKELTAFIAAIQERMHGYIKGTERVSALRPAQFQGFVIR